MSVNATVSPITDSYEPSVALTSTIVYSGVYSSPFSGLYDAGVMASIHHYAFNFTPSGEYSTDGQILSIQQNTALYSLIGTYYGGDGQSTFELPNFDGILSIGGLTSGYIGYQEGTTSFSHYLTTAELPYALGGSQQPIAHEAAALNTNFVINVNGIYPASGPSYDTIGLVWQFAGTAPSDGNSLPCDGRLLNISDYQTLFALIGTTYGGDGQTTFALPDLRGRTIIGDDGNRPIGSIGGSDEFSITQANLPVAMGGSGASIDMHEPSLALHLIICTQGVFPSRDDYGSSVGEQYLGEIVAYAGNSIPSGWAPCNGQTLPIQQYAALFSLLGTTYGGDGVRNFRLPNLAEHSISGAYYGSPIGSGNGGTATNSLTLTLDNIPSLNLSGDSNANTLYGANQGDTLNGNGGNDTIIAHGGNDTLNGGMGADAMTGGTGDDTYYVDDSGDVVTENPNEGTDTVYSSISYTLTDNVENLILTGTDNLNGTGNDLDNQITGNDGNNILDGGAGADTMVGGGGDDRYVVDNVGDVVTENADAGNDTVVSSIAYVLGDNVENLVLTGSASINGNGNALDNVLTGNDGNNLLNGLGGADVMLGGLGDDSYYVDNANDVIVENAGEGLDLVRANVSVSLSDNVENLILYGTGDIYGVGNSSANTMIGNNGANTLDGGAGADYLRGGYGDDTYVVDNSGDKVVEGVGGGHDRVQSSINYTLGSYVEDLLLTGTAAINGSGNALDNTIIGNSAANTLNGGLGADTMIGGDGNDIYLVDNSGDMVIEHAGEGLDLVKSTASFVLGANIENLLLYGTGAIDGTGNDLANSIVGNAAANRLDGGAGADYLRGGAGNDTYVVDNAGDKVVEGAGAGTDGVEASINYTLGSYVENLTLTGNNEINGTGNGLDNSILGNGADNILKGGAGSDVLNGGGGSDVLTGGTGNDTFLFNAGLWAGNVDQITDFSVGSDVIGLSQSIFALTSNGGHLAAGEFVAGTAALDADDHIIYDSVTGNLYYDADGNGGSDQILFAHVTAGTALTHNDFMIVG